MNLSNSRKASLRRKAVSTIIATMMMFAILFAGGVGFLLFANQNALTNNQANAARQAALQQASVEKLVLGVKNSTVADPWGQKGDLWLRVNNTGGVTSTILDVYVTNVANGQLISNTQVPPASHYLSVQGTLAQKGDLNVTLPLSISMGSTTQTMTGCVSGKIGCDIAISKMSYSYAHGTTVLVSVLTSTGNVFSVQYPQGTKSTGIQTNALVISLAATPPQTLTCSNCVKVTATVYNYALFPVTGVALYPSPPSTNVTGTATVTGGSCTGPFRWNGLPMSNDTISAYSGSGTAHYVYFTCTYSANTGPVGGFASFSGAATGVLNGISISSATEVSNNIQIGGIVSVLNQGPFTANSFFFKDSYCYQKSGIFYVSPCTQTPSPLSIANLPSANPQNASADYYVAYYVNITNNFNVTLPILQYSYFQTDPTLGGESDFYLVGATSSYCSAIGYDSAGYCSTAFFPNYTPNTPALTSYGGDAATCANNPANCIEIPPGATATLTFAACRFGTAYWNWGDSQYGRAFDNPVGCAPQGAPNYQTPESTYLSIIVSFLYKGQVMDQQIPFQGETILGGKSGGGTASCSTGNFCGTVVYTQYSGTVGYFTFVYNPTAKKLTIPTPTVINSNLPHGADGVVYNPQDHKLLVGTNAPNDQSPYFNEVNPNTGVATTYNSNIYSLNVMVSSDGTRVYMDGDPGTGSIAWAPLTPTIGATTTLTISGDDHNLNTVIFVDSTHVYYTSECNGQCSGGDGNRFQGFTGHVGTLDITTGKTTCFKTGASCKVFNGVHGGNYDPFTGDLIVYGWNVINQINPATGASIANETVTGLDTSTGNFDQGAVDGLGHLFISFAGYPGYLYFEDYSGGTIGQTNFNVITTGGLNTCSGVCTGFTSGPAFNYIDDLAPIVGPGSQG